MQMVAPAARRQSDGGAFTIHVPPKSCPEASPADSQDSWSRQNTTREAVPAKPTVGNAYRSRDERIPVTEEQWSRKGDAAERISNCGLRRSVKTGGTKGRDAMIVFEGTGAIISDSDLATGGTAEIDLDGEVDRTAGPYPDEHGSKDWESFWRNHRLDDGRLAEGSEIALTHLRVFRYPPSLRGLWGTMARPGPTTVPSG